MKRNKKGPLILTLIFQQHIILLLLHVSKYIVTSFCHACIWHIFIKSFWEVWKLKVIYVTNWKMLFKAVFPTGVLSRGPLCMNWPLYLAVWDFLQKAFEVQTKSKSTKLCKKCTLPPFATKDSTLQWWLPERIKCLSFSIIWKHLEKHQVNTIDNSQNISNSSG